MFLADVDFGQEKEQKEQRQMEGLQVKYTKLLERRFLGRTFKLFSNILRSESLSEMNRK